MSDNRNNEIQASAGAYLKRLREEKNLSIEDVSARLYLTPHIIEALEQDDHERLPIETYVYGYLQNYAKLLDTPADQVVAMYKADTTEQPEQVPERQPGPKTGQSKKWPFTVIYLVAFAALLLPFTWWRSQYTQEAVISAGADSSNAATSALDYPITIVEHPDTPFYRAPNTEQAAPAPQPGLRETGPDREFDSPADTYGGNTITTGIGPDSIRLVITDDCWIEIFDAGNEKVFYDLARNDQVLVLNGTAPFSVLLGNAEAVTVEFNTVPFDTTPHMSRIGMARFVLGEEQTSR